MREELRFAAIVWKRPPLARLVAHEPQVRDPIAILKQGDGVEVLCKITQLIASDEDPRGKIVDGQGTQTYAADLVDVSLETMTGSMAKNIKSMSNASQGSAKFAEAYDKLGVSVTYSDINNTAVLMEIAARRGNSVPDLSFGTHFFQDLVEGDIRYIPLYPDRGGQQNLRRAGGSNRHPG